MREHELTVLGKAPEAWDKAQLVEILDREIVKEVPDDELVLAILGELKRRDAERPVELTQGQRKLWKAHGKKLRRKRCILPNGLIRAAVAVLVLGALVLAMPQEATAGGLWKTVARWTADIFRYENIGGGTEAAEEAGFRTDNPGLQAVYDALGELGIEPRPVPEWIPEGYALQWMDKIDTDALKGVNVGFSDGEKELVLSYKEMKKDLSPDYDKSDAEIVEFECNGIDYNMVWNSNTWVINWTMQNLKCFLSIECREEVAKQIIRSIY